MAADLLLLAAGGTDNLLLANGTDNLATTTETGGATVEFGEYAPLDLTLCTAELTGPGLADQPTMALGAYDSLDIWTITVPELTGFEVTTCHVARKLTTDTKVATFVAFAAGHGGQYWAGNTRPDVEVWIDDMTSRGVDMIQVKWSDGWDNLADLNIRAGPGRCAARVATLVKGLQAAYGDGVTFAIGGTSGGASQVTYCMNHYGLGAAGVVDVCVPISGPPHAALMKGIAGDAGYDYSGAPDETEAPHDHADIIDAAWGYPTDEGPANTHDTVLGLELDADTQSADYVWTGLGAARVVHLIGGDDSTIAPRHAWDEITATGTQVRWIDTAGHGAQGNAQTRDWIYKAVTQIVLEAGVRQMGTLEESETPGTTFTLALPFETAETKPVVAGLKLNANVAEFPALDGWLSVAAVDFGTRGFRLLETGGDGTAMSAVFTSTSAQGGGGIVEIDGLSDPSVDVNYTTGTLTANPYTIGPTVANVTLGEYGMAWLSVSGNQPEGTWTDGYTELFHLNGVMGVAGKALSATEVQSTEETVDDEVQAVGVLVTLGAAGGVGVVTPGTSTQAAVGLTGATEGTVEVAA